MKRVLSKVSDVAPFIFFPLLLIFRKRKPALYGCIVLMMLCTTSCYLNYYTTNTRATIDGNTLSRLKSERKYFIIHFFNSTYGLENMSIEGENLHGNLVTLNNEHLKYLHPKSVDKNRYRKIDAEEALAEVHLYTNANSKQGDSIFSASLSTFNRSDIYEVNESATRRNHIMSTVGIILTVAGIAGTIALISVAASIGSGCNCPQVYMDNAGTYSFASGLYSGAVYSTLERTDYLPLKEIPASSKEIAFKISNAKNEEQFINKVQLLRVDHQAGVQILSDRHGNFFSYTTPASPLSISSKHIDTVINALSKIDKVYYSFDNRANDNGLSDLVLKFKWSPGEKAKLVIHGRNTFWSGLLHKEFISLFGDNFEKWKHKQENANTKDLEKWQTDQAIPLMVYIKTAAGWRFVDYFPLIGNTASRDMIMEINTEKTTGDNIELKLETAYRFWDIDFAGVDYSANVPLTKTVIDPGIAITSDSIDSKSIISKSDSNYVHLTGEASIYFKYAISPSVNNNQASYFLISGGYYHNLEKITGKSDIVELYKFQKKGAFDKFSRSKYQQTLEFAALMNGSSKK